MSDRIEQELDERLKALAEDLVRETPVPSDDLMARILADAADVAAETRPAPVQPAPRRGWRINLAAALPIWSGSAVAVLAVGLFIGISIGYNFGGDAIALEALGSQAGLGFDDSFMGIGGPL